MGTASFQETRLQDYRPPEFLVDSVDLVFELDAERTLVASKLCVRRAAGTAAGTPVVLDGHSFELLSVAIDGHVLEPADYQQADGKLTLSQAAERFELEIRTALKPAANRSGEGLFALNGKLATQCEAEGFRRLTPFFDRPDVLSVYRVTLIADPVRYPVLLSNGSITAQGQQGDGRHWVTWEDPHPKPCYLFAVMAGDWQKLEDHHVTPSGRRITLGIHADHDVIGQCAFAMDALKRSLRWEEQTFGLEYDLDCYNIVALSDYMGAMENKGLNLFGSEGIVADPRISTDDDYMLIERILAHEVFHNWTGNRVTCRDWFQLSIKEGLTRFRDQLFAQDTALPDFKRIDQVKALRRNQFPEDTGPAAHPVQPKSYFEIRNFYTATIYEKGAEVVRMLYHLLGRETFIRGVRHYLDTYDGQAVTKDQFLASMERISGRDLSSFLAWYDRAGRPLVKASGNYDAERRTYALTLTQHNLLSPHDTAAPPYPIPVAMGLIGKSGREVPAVCEGQALNVLHFAGTTTAFRFDDVPEPVVPSLFRGFSAPVTYESGLSDDDLAHLMAHDTDAFSRWDAAQQLGILSIRRLAASWRAGERLVRPEAYGRSFAASLADRNTDGSVLGEILRIPDEPALSDGLDRIDLDAHVAGRTWLCRHLAELHRDELLTIYHASTVHEPYRFDPAQISRRRLRNACLELLLAMPSNDLLDLCLRQVTAADNMTDSFEALSYLCQIACPQREEALAWFLDRWRAFPRVVDKWFMVQALSRTADAIDRFLVLEKHPEMDMSNAPRAFWFYGSFFRQNRVAFHDPSGRGYEVLVERLLFIDRHKPGVSMRFMPQILQWRRYDDHRRALMKAALERLAGSPGISSGLYENVTRALAEPA